MTFKLGNKGLAVTRILGAMIALFVLTLVFITGDPVVDKIYNGAYWGIEDPRDPSDLLEASWNIVVPVFLLIISIYILTAGRETDTPSRFEHIR